MKKLVLLSIMIITIFVLLGCNSNDNATTDAHMENVVSNNNDSNDEVVELISTTIDNSVTTDDVVVKTEIDPKKYSTRRDSDMVSFDANDISYNEAGELVVTGNVINDSEYRVGSIYLNKFKLYNDEDELIASNSFGYLPKIVLKPEEEIEWTFTFPAVTVLIKDDNLEYIETVSKFTSNY